MAASTSNGVTDFLRFSAYSMKDLITRKLSENSNFTDQIYEGSNLAILIDLVSYMYQCLVFQLNSAAAESMFQDTQIYENINRLVNMIGYHPKGVIPARLNVAFSGVSEAEQNTQFFPFTRLDTGLTGTTGKIYFSLPAEPQAKYVNDHQYTYQVFYNGSWKRYQNVLEASGIEYETFILQDLMSDADNGHFVAPDFVKVWVESNGQYEGWEYDSNEIFIQAINSTILDTSSNENRFAKIYGQDAKIYTVRLNENKQLELKFGNGIVGKRLQAGDRLHVFYLETNGAEGDINLQDIDPAALKIEHDPSMFGFSSHTGEELDPLFQKIFGVSTLSSYNDWNVAGLAKTLSSEWSDIIVLESMSKSKGEETVQDIQENAPNWFKVGNRLITKTDYEYFFRNYDLGIVDVKCMNNWDYMTVFYRWLYNLGVNPNAYSKRQPNGYQFLEKTRLVNNGFQYVDSADANNIYLWIKYADEKDNLSQLKSAMNDEIQLIKTMTSETYPMAPIDVYFDISFTPDNLYYDQLSTVQNSSFDFNYSYLEVTMTDNSIYSNTTIVNKVAQIIRNAFKTENCKIGQKTSYSSILDSIYGINGVERVRTVFYPDPDNQEIMEIANQYGAGPRYCDGIAFASWTNMLDLIPIGEDLQINNTMRQLEDFQFPRLCPYTLNNLCNKIKVIKKSMNTINPIKF